MASVLGVTALWLVFGGTHIGLATRRVRVGLVSRLGERGFVALFSLIAAVSFSVLVHYYTLHRFDGPPGLALGAVPALRWTLMAVVVVGIVLIAASLVVYPRSPMALFNKTVRAACRGARPRRRPRRRVADGPRVDLRARRRVGDRGRAGRRRACGRAERPPRSSSASAVGRVFEPPRVGRLARAILHRDRSRSRPRGRRGLSRGAGRHRAGRFRERHPPAAP